MAYFLGENANCPVYIQRYMTTIEILRENAIGKVIDFGCAELNFVLRLKHEKNIGKICAVDIDEDLLERHHNKLQPLALDYIQSMRRELPLTYYVFCGSVAETDERLLGYDAVTCIELIEHLENNILDKLPAVVFGFIKPKMAIFTTPNSDFNVLFKDFKGFRHWDHKFEWSRLEFKKWCDDILTEYSDYTVEIRGIGEGPAGTEHLGCCSQMAIFKKITNSELSINDKIVDEQKCPYKLITEIIYPVKRKISREDEIYRLVCDYLSEISSLVKDDLLEDVLEVPLTKLLEKEKLFRICSDENELKEILCGYGEKIGTDEEGKFFVIYKLCDSDDELSSTEDNANVMIRENVNNDSECEIWDL